MARTQINCPNCKQPIVADVEQLFDVAKDPSAKPKLLSGITNFVQCQVCGYQGALATPIVYHDPDKELLGSYYEMSWLYLHPEKTVIAFANDLNSYNCKHPFVKQTVDVWCKNEDEACYIIEKYFCKM